MPPKDNKKSSKAERDLVDEEQHVADEIVKASLRLSALQSCYLSRLDEVAALKKERDELQCACARSEDNLHAAARDRLDILTDFARQYKTIEGEKILVGIGLDAALNHLQEEKLKLTKELETTDVEYDSAISAMKTEYETLSTRIAEMEKEFSVLMEDTSSRISLS